jgi:hypothetical protein
VTLVHHIHHVLKHKIDLFSLKHPSFQEIQTSSCVTHATLFTNLSSSKLSTQWVPICCSAHNMVPPTFTIIVFITFCQCSISY